MKDYHIYDVVVWGATGNIGRRVSGLLLAECFRNRLLRVCLVCKNKEKLNCLLKEMEACNILSTAIADSLDKVRVEEITKNAKIVISCVGPYTSQGNCIIKYCAEHGIDYIDVSGESLWIRDTINQYHHKAQQTGARIVSSCGFDSIPSDLSVYFLQKIASSVFGQPVSSIKARIQSMKTIPLSAGTMAAHKVLMSKADNDSSVLAFLRDPFGLTNGFTGAKQPQANAVKFDEELGCEAAPFWGAAINTKTVHRSNQLLNFPYGRDFLYDEMISVDGDGRNAALIKELGQFAGQQQITDKSEQNNSSCDGDGSWLMFWHGFLENKEVIRVRVAGKQDPAYGTSSALAVESALCLLEDNISTKGGMWTPASCMGQDLLNRLSDRRIIDISWEVFQPALN